MNIKQRKKKKMEMLMKLKYISLDPSSQGVNRLFVMAYNRLAAANDDQFNKNCQQKYYLPRNDLNEYNVIIDEEIFMIIRLKMILKNKEN